MSWVQHARGLYAIVDPAHCGERSPIEVARSILSGGCALLQLRDKSLSDAEQLRLARSIRAECAARSVPFVVNDRPDLAILAEADGLHLGQDDISVADARRLVGDLPIGLSTHDEAQALRAATEGADLIGFGPIFDTKTKVDAEKTVGLEKLEAICRASTIPVVAIGGIDLGSAPEVMARGSRWVAAISAICGAEDPEEAARRLHQAVSR